jgi:murein DD-endopeptidase MepM/ murein hydrolase activator NlpD
MRSRHVSLGAPLLAAALVFGDVAAGGAATDTSTTTVPPDTTPTTSTSTSTTTTTTAVAPQPGPGDAPSTEVAPSPVATGGDAPVDDFVVPPELLARARAVRRSRPNNLATLLAATRALAHRTGLSLEQAIAIAFGHVPVAGPAHWVHDWLDPRRGPPIHLHQGIDVWAAMDTPVRAPFAGRLRYERGGLGGLAAYVTASDGTYYYLAHLNDAAPLPRHGATVTQGQVIGFVGDSGNARGGPPHLHFEIHPRGGAAVDPKAVLDRWVTEATMSTFALVSAPAAVLSPPGPPAGPPYAPSARPAPAPRALRAVSVRTDRRALSWLVAAVALIALGGGRLRRRVRANMACSPDEHDSGETTRSGQGGPWTRRRSPNDSTSCS